MHSPHAYDDHSASAAAQAARARIDAHRRAVMRSLIATAYLDGLLMARAILTARHAPNATLDETIDRQRATAAAAEADIRAAETAIREAAR